MIERSDKSIASSPCYRWRLLRAGPLQLDGGGMFGVIPRVVWSRNTPPDETGRITVWHNSLLLERVSPVQGQPKRILIETGSGDKFGPKSRKIFGLTDRTIVDAVEETGILCEQIDAVVLTHLHFDHAGGLTRRARAGEKPQWTGPSESETGVVLTFPNAPVFVQKREWDDALANRSVMTRTYLRDHLDPIRDHVRLIEAAPPFPPGSLLERDQLPSLLVSSRQTAILPGINGFLIPGHTWGQQAIRFTDESGQTIVFTPDVMPTIHHVGRTYNLAYDVEPYMSTISRHWFLDEAARQDWLLVLVHEPNSPLCHVRPDAKGWYQLLPQEGAT